MILINKHHSTKSVKVEKLRTITSLKGDKNDQLQKITLTELLSINIILMKFVTLKCLSFFFFFTKSENFFLDEISAQDL